MILGKQWFVHLAIGARGCGATHAIVRAPQCATQYERERERERQTDRDRETRREIEREREREKNDNQEKKATRRQRRRVRLGPELDLTQAGAGRGFDKAIGSKLAMRDNGKAESFFDELSARDSLKSDES